MSGEIQLSTVLQVGIPLVTFAFGAGALWTRMQSLEKKFEESSDSFSDFKKEVKEEFRSVTNTLDGVRRFIENAISGQKVIPIKSEFHSTIDSHPVSTGDLTQESFVEADQNDTCM